MHEKVITTIRETGFSMQQEIIKSVVIMPRLFSLYQMRKWTSTKYPITRSHSTGVRRPIESSDSSTFLPQLYLMKKLLPKTILLWKWPVIRFTLILLLLILLTLKMQSLLHISLSCCTKTPAAMKTTLNPSAIRFLKFWVSFSTKIYLHLLCWMRIICPAFS